MIYEKLKKETIKGKVVEILYENQEWISKEGEIDYPSLLKEYNKRHGYQIYSDTITRSAREIRTALKGEGNFQEALQRVYKSVFAST